jgi:NADH-quinone oxidoreductase subunit N
VATEAAMKYFVLGALASGLLLYGMSMLYGATGTLDLAEIASRLSSWAHDPEGGDGFGLVFIVVGVGFKLGAVPFHMWVPDVYQGAPTAITLFIASAPKLAAFGMAFRLLVDGLEPLVRRLAADARFLAVLSMVVGNLAAIAQTNIKRMLAYSTISHVGFLMLGMVSGVVGENWHDANWLSAADAYSASMFYAITYVHDQPGHAFGMIMYDVALAGFEAENLDDFKGLNAPSPRGSPPSWRC